MRKFVIIAFLLACWSPSAMAQVAIIAHKDVPAAEITKERVLDFYSGESRWWTSDIPVVVLDLKAKGDVRDTFYKFLGRSSSRMKSIWLRRKLSGEGEPPETMDDAAELIAKVASTPGSIGYVHIDVVQGNPDIKVLALVAMEL